MPHLTFSYAIPHCDTGLVLVAGILEDPSRFLSSQADERVLSAFASEFERAEACQPAFPETRELSQQPDWIPNLTWNLPASYNRFAERWRRASVVTVCQAATRIAKKQNARDEGFALVTANCAHAS